MAGTDIFDPENLSGEAEHSDQEKIEATVDLHLDPDAEPLPDFLDHFGGKCRGILIPYAAQVYLIVQIGSLNLAAEYFSARFGRKFSTRPIRDVLEKIERGIIPLSREEILEAAELHPAAKRFLGKAPWAIDPKKAARIDPVLPRRKPGRPPKSGKTANEAAGKPARKTAGAEENLNKEPTKTNGDLAGKSTASEEISGENPAQSRTGSGTDPEKNPGETQADNGQKGATGGTNPAPKRRWKPPFTPEELERKRLLVEGIEADLKAEEDRAEASWAQAAS